MADTTPYKSGHGSMAAATAETIEAATAAGRLGPLDRAAAALAIECAAAVDIARGRHDSYAIATATNLLLKILDRLGLLPAAPKDAGGDNGRHDDELAGFLAGLSAPEMGNSSQP